MSFCNHTCYAFMSLLRLVTSNGVQYYACKKSNFCLPNKGLIPLDLHTQRFGRTKTWFRPVWSFWLVRPKCSSPFDKIVVPSIALLCPTYKNNNMLWLFLGLCNQNVLFHWACGINEISNWDFCWKYNYLILQTEESRTPLSHLEHQHTSWDKCYM